MTVPPANENAFQTEIKTFKTENLRVRPNCFDRSSRKSVRHIGTSSTVPAATENAFQTEIKIFKNETSESVQICPAVAFCAMLWRPLITFPHVWAQGSLTMHSCDAGVSHVGR